MKTALQVIGMFFGGMATMVLFIFLVCKLFHFQANAGGVFIPSIIIGFVAAAFTLVMIDTRN